MLKISVIIPSYNQGQFLEETILSVLEQDYPLLELFIIDGDSTDNSKEIIIKYQNNLAGWIIEKDSGQSEAINKGLKMSSGEIVSWLCSDDIYMPGTLKKINELFSSLPDYIGLIHGNSEIFNSGRTLYYDKGYGNWSDERQLAGMTFPQPSSFMRRSAVEKAGFLNDSLHFGMDYDLFSRLIMICDFRYEDFYFSKYRLHNESKSTTSISKFIDEWILIFNSIIEGLGYVKIRKELIDAGLKTQPDNKIMNYFSVLKNKKELNEQKLLFYFLVNVIRYDYATSKFSRVKRIANILKKEYGNYLKLEPSILKIVRRSFYFPSFMLRLARNFKRSLTKE